MNTEQWKVGDIQYGREICRRPSNRKYVLQPCVDCGKLRWIWHFRFKKITPRCAICNGKKRAEEHPSWKGGRTKNKLGYILIKLQPNDFFYSMTDKRGYVLEHRLVIARLKKRCLLRWEVVHHRNGIKDDNRHENLELLPTIKQHLPTTIWQRELSIRDKQIAELEKRITLLEAENVILKAERQAKVYDG